MSTISSSTTSTTAYKVTADTTGTLVIQTGATPTTAVTVDASQNVGVGTSFPNARLQIDSSSATYSANIRSRNSNFGNGVVGAASNILTIATDMNNMAFYTVSNLGVDGTSAPTNERMRIDSSGNVGIGTASPSTRLTVLSSTNQGIAVNDGTVNTILYNTGSANGSLGTTTNHPMAFYTNNTEQARITAAGLFQFNSGYGSVATAYGCRAWVNFDGVTTATIRASGNVTSVTRNSAGDYTINFTNAMPDVNYCVTSSNKYDNANTSFANGVTVVARYTTAYQTGSVRVQTGISAATDTVAVCVAIFR